MPGAPPYDPDSDSSNDALRSEKSLLPEKSALKEIEAALILDKSKELHAGDRMHSIAAGFLFRAETMEKEVTQHLKDEGHPP